MMMQEAGRHVARAILHGSGRTGARVAPSWSGLMSGSARCISGSSVLSTWWGHVGPAPKDPILGVTESYLADPSDGKVNVGVGAYRDDNGQPVVLECVRMAEQRIAGIEYMEYLPMAGMKRFNGLAIKLAYGDDSPVIKERRVAAVQALSGTGACRLMADLQHRFRPESQVFFPVPTWSNHLNIWRDANVMVKSFRYYNPKTKGLDFEGMMEDVKNAPNGSFFVLHACAHNPTGVDPSTEEWKEVSSLFKEKNHFVVFDMAYQGFASGDTSKDRQAIRIFLEDGHQVACAQSFAKNMGLYGQRIGCLSIVCHSEMEAANVQSQVQQIARPMYSNPPLHGAHLVATILSDPGLKELWLKEVKMMADRIKLMRSLLREHLEGIGSQINWEHITKQIGMFCFSGLTPAQVDELTKNYHIYMTRNGRISMAGVTTKNVEYLAHAIHTVTKAQK
ncbi:hypothetical protein CBR_g34329 [Chara braunii]|uniref:Aspartate aminotransferase n=1 Tax=Chara braunii TaxID=69332 RepID=A0A388LI98_CHABU|nr:hypothetical protein CBR_g34329 [Chara braunii]|eukprot:GBG82050.1 hypothetical protein CBR_g34329 [Chara braunii]